MKFFLFALLSFLSFSTFADDGSNLWLNYQKMEDAGLRKQYIKAYRQIIDTKSSEKTAVAANEIQMALKAMTGVQLSITSTYSSNKTIVLEINKTGVAVDGYTIKSTPKGVTISGNNESSLLYGAFAFIRNIQTGKGLTYEETSTAKIQYRMLNHWDNANGTVERGYAGSSIWKWNELPEVIDPRIITYARANASIGINAVSINNVNASSRFLTAEYLRKIKGVADVLRPYGIKVFISINFKSPKTLGGLETSDPLDAGVRKWWKEKTDEIYDYVPDFGGYLVKANSEGEPGPQDYGRTHADGANMLADALKERDGIIIWRAFVYDADPNGDRFKEAYLQFKPLDGKFDKKVVVQVKNGPIDFMPREPFHPMFGQFPKTPLALEFQITQEYLGQSTHLTYLAPMFKECLDSDTYAKGEGSTVAKVVDGSLDNQSISVMAGVANTGSDANFTGHPFNQANWYAFGRLAWDYTLSSDEIAQEWTMQTLSQKPSVVTEITKMMDESLPIYIKYTYPLGLHHMMGESHHYGPQPWLEKSGRPDWTSIYYHRAASDGIGFDRTGKQSDALSLYRPEVQQKWNNAATCDLNYLLWFHHLPWDYQLSTGRTVWNELMTQYFSGVEDVAKLQEEWASLKSEIDPQIYENVAGRLAIQHREAIWWRDACFLYFKQFSKMPAPAGYEAPKRSLEDVKEIEEVYHLR